MVLATDFVQQLNVRMERAARLAMFQILPSISLLGLSVLVGKLVKGVPTTTTLPPEFVSTSNETQPSV